MYGVGVLAAGITGYVLGFRKAVRKINIQLNDCVAVKPELEPILFEAIKLAKESEG